MFAAVGWPVGRRVFSSCVKNFLNIAILEDLFIALLVLSWSSDFGRWTFETFETFKKLKMPSSSSLSRYNFVYIVYNS